MSSKEEISNQVGIHQIRQGLLHKPRTEGNAERHGFNVSAFVPLRSEVNRKCSARIRWSIFVLPTEILEKIIAEWNFSECGNYLQFTKPEFGFALAILNTKTTYD